MTAGRLFWESNEVICPHCGDVVDRERSNQVTCLSPECQSKQNQANVTQRLAQTKKGERKRKYTHTVLVDTKCPCCEREWQIEIDRPTSVRKRRDYCPNCADLIILRDRSTEGVMGICMD